MPPDWPVGMGYWRTQWRYSSIINRSLLLFERLPVFVTVSILSWLDTYLMNSIKPLTALNSSGKWLRSLKWWDGCCLSSLPKRKWFLKMFLPPCAHIHMLWNPDVCLSFLFKDMNLYEAYYTFFTMKHCDTHIRMTHHVIFVLFYIIKT